MALLVAYSDGELDHEEYDKAFQVFGDIAEEYLGEHDHSVLTGQVERIAAGLIEEIKGLSPEDILGLALDTADRIEDSTSQEVAIIAAIRVAYGDRNLAELESHCIAEIANKWGISLKNLL